MKEIVMEVTMPLLYNYDKANDSYVIPEDFNPKTTEDGVNYIIKETNNGNKD